MTDDKKKMLVAERVVILQAFSEYYLTKTQGKTFGEAFPDEKDEYAVLNKKQIELLHQFLKDEYSEYGLDLEKILAEKGEVFNGTDLTPFESKELVRLADEAIALSAVIMKRKII